MKINVRVKKIILSMNAKIMARMKAVGIIN
jgi:hypothetical protein